MNLTELLNRAVDTGDFEQIKRALQVSAWQERFFDGNAFKASEDIQQLRRICELADSTYEFAIHEFQFVKDVDLEAYGKKEFRPNFKNHTLNSSLLWLAVDMDDHAAMRELLEGGANPDYRFNVMDVKRPAFYVKSPEAYQLLTEHDGNMKAVIRDFVTANKVDAIKLFLDQGFDIDTPIMPHQKYPNVLPPQTRLIHLASQRGNSELIKLCLERNADVLTADEFGKTPAQLAIDSGNVDAVDLFLDAGAIDKSTDIQMPTRQGQTYQSKLLHWACAKGNKKLIDRLIDADASSEDVDKAGNTPVYYAIRQGHTEVAQYLIKRGVDPEGQALDKSTVFHQACFMGNVDILRSLVECGVAINNKDDFNRSALQYAIMSNDPAKVALLLEYGADVTVRSSSGLTMLEVAEQPGRNNPDVVRLIRDALRQQEQVVDGADNNLTPRPTGI